MTKIVTLDFRRTILAYSGNFLKESRGKRCPSALVNIYSRITSSRTLNPDRKEIEQKGWETCTDERGTATKSQA